MTSRRKVDQWPVVRRLLSVDCAVEAKCRGPLLFAYGTEYVYCYEDAVSALEVAVDAGCHSTARLLVAAGCCMVPTDPCDASSWLEELIVESHSLQHLCRLTIRRRLGLRLDAVVDSLTLPVRLKSFLLLDNIPPPSSRAGEECV